jgi:hypothetical protein
LLLGRLNDVVAALGLAATTGPDGLLIRRLAGLGDYDRFGRFAGIRGFAGFAITIGSKVC